MINEMEVGVYVVADLCPALAIKLGTFNTCSKRTDGLDLGVISP